MISGGSETLGYAAEVLVLQGDWEGAQAQLDQALDIVSTYGERIFLPQLLLVQAEIEGARGESVTAEASIRRAVTEASALGASWQECLALIELLERGIAARTRCARRSVPRDGDPSQLERARRLVQNVQQA